MGRRRRRGGLVCSPPLRSSNDQDQDQDQQQDQQQSEVSTASSASVAKDPDPSATLATLIDERYRQNRDERQREAGGEAPLSASSIAEIDGCDLPSEEEEEEEAPQKEAPQKEAWTPDQQQQQQRTNGDGDGDGGGFVPPAFEKDEDDSSFLKNTLMTNAMFQSLPDATLDKLVLAFEEVKYDANADVITQGDPDIDYFYVLYEGECAVTIDGKRLPYPYGTMGRGTVFGELAMLYDQPRAATVSTTKGKKKKGKEDCSTTLYRIDRGTFRHFICTQGEGELEDVKKELRVIDAAIDKVAGVKTRYDGSIIQQYKPQRSWLWRRWKGTVLQHASKWAVGNMAVTAAIALLVGGRADCTWAVGMAPDQSHPVIRRMAAFGKHWKYLLSVTTFILTFFLSQSYAMWRQVYTAGRKVQGRLNDVGFLIAACAARDENGRYTPEAEACLDEVGMHTRLHHIFLWAKFAKTYRVLLTLRGMSRMLSRGLMTRAQFDTLQGSDAQTAGASNAILEWMLTRAIKGEKEGALNGQGSLIYVLMAKASELRGTGAGIADILDGRMPLAYAHMVQIMVDCFLVMAPPALYAELGVWSVLCVGILTLFYSGLLDLAKIFLDPLDNDNFCNDSINMDIGVLIRESNGGSTRWKQGAAVLPF